jgi:hypothetical protein
MPDSTIIAFHRKGFRLCLDKFFRRHKFIVTFPMVCIKLGNIQTFYSCPQPTALLLLLLTGLHR